jgi:V/A-type H+/Na+-transporting ATPase subunit A
MDTGMIVKISGPLVVAEGLPQARLNDVVRVGKLRLIGEIIELHRERVFVQVYEETSGVRPGEPVESLEQPLSVVLGPGLIGSIYDGIQRPLSELLRRDGDFITRGTTAPRIDHEKLWEFTPLRRVGETVEAGDVLGEVQETSLITHRILVPPHLERGEVMRVESGEMTVDDVVAEIRTPRGTESITMLQHWPVRRPRPFRRRHEPRLVLTTGQRVIDTFFPLVKGGTACIPGPFGSGKTVVQHQISKWADAQVIIFIGCGERGNEMTDVLHEFPNLIDPHSGRPLMERTILIANTSNMPVAAREASVYTGITLAEYYRDMGYHVAVMADSTSRWAEALREMGGRLEEMPGEEGYPAYLGTRLAEFYARAGHVTCLGTEARDASISIIGAVSPPGGDLADPVVQATLRVVKVFWSLDARLAYERHFPAIHWLHSYSLYEHTADSYLRVAHGEQPVLDRNLAMRLLEEEDELTEIVRLVGVESLSPLQRLNMRTAQAVREDFLHQNAFIPEDSFTSFTKQTLLLRGIIHLYDVAREALEAGVKLDDILALPAWERLAEARYFAEDDGSFASLRNETTNDVARLKRPADEGRDGEGAAASSSVAEPTDATPTTEASA